MTWGLNGLCIIPQAFPEDQRLEPIKEERIIYYEEKEKEMVLKE